MVAESTLILAPMDQIGWRTATSGVTAAISAKDMVRHGPPEAVRIIFATADGSRISSAWKMALCSLSTGRMVAPPARAAAKTGSPAQTRLSLLAIAITPPRASAAMVAGRPAAPTMAAMVQSAGRLAAAITASGPAATWISVPASASFKALYCEGSASTAWRAFSRRACAARPCQSRPATRATMSNWPSGAASSRETVLFPTEPVLPRTVMRRGAAPFNAIAVRLCRRAVQRRSRAAPPPSRHPTGQTRRHARE